MNFNIFAGCKIRCVGSTLVYGCENECTYYCRVFVTPKTPFILSENDSEYAEFCNDVGVCA